MQCPSQLYKNKKSGVSPLSFRNPQPGYLSIGLLSRDGTRIDGVRAPIGGVISGCSCLARHSLGDEIETPVGYDLLPVRGRVELLH